MIFLLIGIFYSIKFFLQKDYAKKTIVTNGLLRALLNWYTAKCKVLFFFVGAFCNASSIETKNFYGTFTTSEQVSNVLFSTSTRAFFDIYNPMKLPRRGETIELGPDNVKSLSITLKTSFISLVSEKRVGAKKCQTSVACPIRLAQK